MNKEYTPAEAKAWLSGYDAGRKFAGHGLDLPLVKLDEFLLMIKGSEDMRGMPVMRTEWPMEENLMPERNIQTSDTKPAESLQPLEQEPLLEGWPLWSGLPQSKE